MKRIVGLVLISLVFSGLIFAETIILKSGDKVQGTIVEKTSDYIKVDSDGVQLIYFLDEIANVEEGKSFESSAPTIKPERVDRAYSEMQFDMKGPVPAVSGVVFIILLIVILVVIVSLWKVFSKAGQPGWASIIPIYNTYIMIKVAGRPGWWLLLFFLPLVSLIIAIIISIDVAKKFSKGVGYGLGLAFLPFIFLPMLAFGDAQYIG